MKFGLATDTLDSFGKITKIDTDVDISKENIESVLNEFIGNIEQYPPKFSALKVNGKKAYELAREGVEFELKPRKITIYSILLREKLDKNTYIFDVECSAGTYIRTLFSDIAERLGTVAYVPVIIRTKSGAFEMKNAITLEELENSKNLTKIEEVFSNLNVIELNDFMAKKVLNGVRVSAYDIGAENLINSPFLIKYKGEIVGLYEIKDKKTNAIAFVYDD